MTFTLIEGRVIVLKKVNKGYMPKSLHDICAFPYYTMHVVMMDFFKLWLLIVEYICFQHFNFIHYINYLGKGLLPYALWKLITLSLSFSIILWNHFNIIVDLIIFCQIFDRMFEISCVHVYNAKLHKWFFFFTLKCAILV